MYKSNLLPCRLRNVHHRWPENATYAKFRFLENEHAQFHNFYSETSSAASIFALPKQRMSEKVRETTIKCFTRFFVIKEDISKVVRKRIKIQTKKMGKCYGRNHKRERATSQEESIRRNENKDRAFYID